MRALCRAAPLCTVAVLLTLSACGGGGQSLSRTPTAPQGSANVAVSIKVPGPATTQSTKRRPNYVSASTQSAAIAVDGGTPVTIDLSTSSNCLIVAGSQKCTVTVTAPVGMDTFLITLYDGANGTGNALSSASISQTIVTGPNALNAVTYGVVSQLQLSLSATSLSVLPSVPATIAVTANALDADGNIIIGPGGYGDANGNPLTVTLSDTDTSGATTLSQTSFSQAPGGITLTFNGNPPSGPVTITASAPGVTSSAVNLPVTAVFGYTGAAQTYRLPPGVAKMTIVGAGPPGSGGSGATVTATVPVAVSGETLSLSVGGTPSGATGGFNGGGNADSSTGCNSGGGGATDVREGGSALGNRIVVGAGGGGGGCDNGFGGGGAGNGGTPTGTAGGNVAGFSAGVTAGSVGGAGGTAAAGGTGGLGGTSTAGNGSAGTSGTFGQGGNGGAGSLNTCSGQGGAGGGGGSSFAEASATGVSYATNSSGIPQITITY